MEIVLLIWYLVDSCIVADDDSVETNIVAKDVSKDFRISHAVYAMHGVVARHYHAVFCQTYHSLVRHQDFLHHLLLFCLTSTAIAEIVL